MTTSFDLHAELIAAGFTHTHHDQMIYDDGDGETGPLIRHEPEYDHYMDAEVELVIHEGRLALVEMRDYAMEAWFDEMADAEVSEDPGPGYSYRDYAGQGE